ncbi:MAG: DUF2971 domain-containing protein [Alphaproteobacteria bacterium]|jgi:hypothetical protein|nr:DUF2971 domain-containing protein [Alphaproteobacteria bacterium]MBU2337619.1 DUF2971 domain-containing protein [Alphaproteobacteria bacterium]|tara:strand:- start:379 stop:1203 length:825 start_codon:yes stop_codon:yes gene_type:complete
MKSDSESDPQYLSHYTTLAGFQGIVDSRCLWASNASFLNDRAELLLALDASKKAISLLSSKKAMAAYAPLLKRVFDELSVGRRSEAFVSCFCKDDDNLSQWRGYGGLMQGISITFDRQLLTERLGEDHARLYKVSYTKLSTARRLRDELAGELSRLADLRELVAEGSEEQRYKDLRSRASALLPKFKHLGFRDEREWRYVVQDRPDDDSVSFRPVGNKLVPYITIGDRGTPLPLVSVRVGPGTDQELTARSIKEFLRARGYQAEVNVSDVPFRI